MSFGVRSAWMAGDSDSEPQSAGSMRIWPGCECAGWHRICSRWVQAQVVGAQVILADSPTSGRMCAAGGVASVGIAVPKRSNAPGFISYNSAAARHRTLVASAARTLRPVGRVTADTFMEEAA